MTDRGKMLLHMFGSFAVAYLIVIAGLAFFQRDLIYHPDNTPFVPTEWDLPQMKKILATTTDGLEITSWYHPATGKLKPTIVFFQGNTGQMGIRHEKVRSWINDGFGVVLTGYRGYSGNPGKPTEQGLYSDARATLDKLRDEGLRNDEIVLYGESLGTGVAVQMAIERHFGAVMLEAPYTSIPDVGAGQYPFVPVSLLTIDRFDSIAKIDQISTPLFVMHGDADRLVPYRMGQALFEAANQPKVFISVPNGEHNNLPAGQAVHDFLGQWPAIRL